MTSHASRVRHLLPLLLLLLCACTQDLVLGESREEVVKIEPEDSNSPAEQDMDAAMEVEDLPTTPYLFEPAQMTYAYGCSFSASACFIHMMLIDVSGRLACLTSEDYDILPARAGRYMVSAHELPEGFDGGCPVGDYLIEDPSQDYCNVSRESLLRYGLEYGYVPTCVEHFEWNERGERVRKDVARSGLITVRQDDTSCTFDFEIVFARIPDYTGSFSIELDELPAELETRCVQ